MVKKITLYMSEYTCGANAAMQRRCVVMDPSIPFNVIDHRTLDIDLRDMIEPVDLRSLRDQLSVNKDSEVKPYLDNEDVLHLRNAFGTRDGNEPSRVAGQIRLRWRLQTGVGGTDVFLLLDHICCDVGLGNFTRSRL